MFFFMGKRYRVKTAHFDSACRSTSNSPAFGMWRALVVVTLGLRLAPTAAQLPPLPPAKARTSRTLAPCQACRLFAGSFQRELDRTERGNFEGGDAAWEEEKLGSYARSEVRLVEIQEKLCSDVKEHQERCHSVSEIAEAHIEEWWFKTDSRTEDFFQYLCIEKLKNCCPNHHYGENCEPCKGGVEDVCNGNGKCKGDGTRKGNGECACDLGYKGERCELCESGYYESYKDDKKALCSKCHKACNGQCVKGGVTGCTSCNQGWAFEENQGCVDIDECGEKASCDKNKFCVNEEGSFQCLDCDKSCDGCTGDGPDMCLQCGAGFSLKDSHCVESRSAQMSQRVTVTRYLTYLGLCVTVCIIFQKSTILAGVLGLLVTMYISVSEYMLADDNAGFNPTIDPSQIDFAKLLGRS